ncbi:TIGR01841 family phasin [Undibacterium arcticum]|uniref:TIGR01841 family phasin n=1 Tax=Undibacterium arcticum TaxID=1762892 RepID=UPI0036082F3E
MFSNTEQYTSASKAFFESQLAALSALTSIAVHGTEKLVALNMEVAKASAADTAAAAKDLLAAKDPQAFFSLATAYTTPNAESCCLRPSVDGHRVRHESGVFQGRRRASRRSPEQDKRLGGRHRKERASRF